MVSERGRQITSLLQGLRHPEAWVRNSAASVAESWDLHLHPMVVGLAGLALLVALAGLAVAVALRRRQLAAWSKVQGGSPRPRTTRIAWLFAFGGLALAMAIELVVFSL